MNWTSAVFWLPCSVSETKIGIWESCSHGEFFRWIRASTTTLGRLLWRWVHTEGLWELSGARKMHSVHWGFEASESPGWPPGLRESSQAQHQRWECCKMKFISSSCIPSTVIYTNSQVNDFECTAINFSHTHILTDLLKQQQQKNHILFSCTL